MIRYPHVLLLLAATSFLAGWAGEASAQKPPTQKPALKTPADPAIADVVGPQQTKHYPILVIAHGTEPTWSLRLGMKGPERLDRAGYPPIVLEPADVVQDDSGTLWTYHARDALTAAAVNVRLTRDSCADPTAADIKYTFRVAVEHAQIGTLNGCGQSSPEQFPEFRKKNQIDPPDDPEATGKDKDREKDKNTVLDPITKFTSPAATAYLDPTGKVILSRGEVRKAVAPAGYELSLSHDGKKLLFTRDLTGANRTIELYDADTGRTQDLATGLVHQAFWSTDDSRIAFLKSTNDKWQVWTMPVNAPDQAALFSPQTVVALHGWASPTTVLASDLQTAFWLGDQGKPVPSIPLKEIYGEPFQIMSSDGIRLNPVNPDLLLVTAYYNSPPTGAPVDTMGLNSSFFLYELRSKRRVLLCPTDTWARSAEWSRDGLQIFYTRMGPGKTFATNRIFWDGSGMKRYSAGNSLAIGK